MGKLKFEQEIEKWLVEVCDRCHEYAQQIDLDFYIMQTPLPEAYNPSLLVIGINPGGEKTYMDALKEKSKYLKTNYTKRTIDSLYYDVNTLTKKPSWEDGKGNDNMRNSLKRIFISENLYDSLDKATPLYIADS